MTSLCFQCPQGPSLSSSRGQIIQGKQPIQCSEASTELTLSEQSCPNSSKVETLTWQPSPWAPPPANSDLSWYLDGGGVRLRSPMHSDKHIPDVSGALPKVWPSQPSPELWRNSLIQSVGEFIGRAHPSGPLENSKPWLDLSVLYQ